jgi:very-short-patch-repair endonuclease
MNDRIFNNFKLRQRRSFLRNSSTLPEDILWKKIRRKQILNTRFRRQVSIGNYITDFFNFELKLVVEVDGKNHDKKEQKEYDAIRPKIIEENDVVFLRF